jgi:hypothetical protein
MLPTNSGQFNRRCAILLWVGGWLSLIPSFAFGWMINEDYQQRDNRNATDFHIVLVGDVGAQITGGGTSSVTNPFADPKVTKTKTTIGNTEVKFEGSNSIPKSTDINRHFGLFGTGAKPKVRFKAWSYATSPFIVPVPKSNFDFAYDLGSGNLSINVENISDDVVTFADVGYLLFPSEQPIENLTRDLLPPEAFLPLSSLSHEYLVGETDQLVIPGVSPSAYLVTYGTVFFSGSSAGNAYNDDGLGTGGEWSQVAVIDQIPVPEPSTLLLLSGGLAMVFRRKWNRVFLLLALVVVFCSPQASYAWTRGNHAGRWAKGATVKIKVDTPPGDAAQQLAYTEALEEAIAEWNTAQAEFGGLKLETTTEGAGDIHVSWHNDLEESTAAGGPPVEIHIGYQKQAGGSLNSRGIARILKHELGHAEGLGHSAASMLMREDAYSSNPGNAPSDADLESINAFIDPTADDKAGKKNMYGTAERLNRAGAASNASFNGSFWQYNYLLQGLVDLGLTNPITQFSLEVPTALSESAFSVLNLPNGWNYQFLDGEVAPGGRFSDLELEAPSLLSFAAESAGDGIFPGMIGQFSLASAFAPADTRVFTNSPSFDSDEFSLSFPAAVPEPTSLVILAMAVVGALIRRKRAM